MTLRVAAIGLFVLVSHDALAVAQVSSAPSAASFIDGSDGLTLSQAIETALSREPGIQSARASIDAARGFATQAGLRSNPSVSFAQQEEPGGTDAQTRVELQWPLDFRRGARVQAADSSLVATQAEVASKERDMVASIRERYGAALTAIRELSISEDLLSAAAAQENLIAARVDQGAAPEIDRRLARGETLQLRAERVELAGRAERELIELKRLLGMPPDAPLHLRASLDDVIRQEGDAAQRGDLEQRADLVEARARVSLKQAELNRVRSEGKPDVTLFGMYMRMDAGFPQSGFGEAGAIERVRGVFHYVSAGVMVSLPVFNRNQGNVTATEAEGVAAAMALDAARLRATAEVTAAQIRVARANEASLAYNDARTLARQNLDVLEQSYQLGRATLTDALDQRRRYLDAERRYTTALGELFAARQGLRHASGDLR